MIQKVKVYNYFLKNEFLNYTENYQLSQMKDFFKSIYQLNFLLCICDFKLFPITSFF